MTYADYMDQTHEVFDLIDNTVAFSGTGKQCAQWVEAQDRPEEYEVREIGFNDESVPSDWWSGGFAKNH